MALITIAELQAALRLGDTAEVTRLHAYCLEAVSQHAPTATETARNEAMRRLSGYLFDMPEAARADGYANAMRSSGAARMLLPYRVHRLGMADAVEAAQAAVGTTDNAVTGLAIEGGQLLVTFEDGSVDALDLGQDAADQVARDSAAAAQSEIDAHERATHNTDITARSTARNARQVGEQAQITIETHEASEHNHDATARTAARAAQTTANTAITELTAHEDTPHGGGGGVDQTARDRASAAQTEIDAHEVATHNTDTTARSTARNARQVGEQAQITIETHEASTHNTDRVARNAAAAAQTAADAAAGGQPPTVLYEAATAAIGGSTGLISGNVVCPETGTIEFYFEGLTGSRQGGIAYARIPAARIRGAVSGLTTAYNNDNVNVLVIPHGANRGIGIAVQATTNYMMLNAQASGNFNIRILHIG